MVKAHHLSMSLSYLSMHGLTMYSDAASVSNFRGLTR